MQSPRNRIAAAAALLALVLVVALSAIGHGGSAGSQQASPRSAQEAPTAMIVGVPTGEFVDGVPVYRLPPIAVTVNRSEEMAKMAREETLALK